MKENQLRIGRAYARYGDPNARKVFVKKIEKQKIWYTWEHEAGEEGFTNNLWWRDKKDFISHFEPMSQLTDLEDLIEEVERN